MAVNVTDKGPSGRVHECDNTGDTAISVKTRGSNATTFKVQGDGSVTMGPSKGIQLTTQGAPHSIHTTYDTFNSQRDDILVLGYNVTPGTVDTKVDASEPSWRWMME